MKIQLVLKNWLKAIVRKNSITKYINQIIIFRKFTIF